MITVKASTEKTIKKQTKKAWLYLFCAIALEIVGVVIIKLLASSASYLSLIFLYISIGISILLLGKSMRYLPMALSYATWQTVGLIGVSIIGVQFFNEDIGLLKIMGMLVLLAGVVLINNGIKK